MRKLVKQIIIGYILFLIIGGVLIFGVYKPRKPRKNNSPNFNTVNKEYVDRAGLVDGSRYSGQVRLSMIESAKETLDISYYTIHPGKSTNVFFESVIDAADRGVKVRFLVDGIFNNMHKKGLNGLVYLMENHPNIEIKFYEPINLLKPWTLNNRLHDKTIIVDKELGLIGGRNIGDKYYMEEITDFQLVRDRDVLVYNEGNLEGSIIESMSDYYDYVWNHRFSKSPVRFMSNRRIKKANRYRNFLESESGEIRKEHDDIVGKRYNFKEITKPVKSIEFVHNPIERFNKRPWAMKRLFKLMDKAEESILIQSPYIIPSRRMSEEYEKFDVDNEKIEILTNSFWSTPNFPAISGYYNNRKRIVDSKAKVNEYQGDDSIHAKTYVIDDKYSIVGSMNLDPRSAYLSTESYLIVEDEEFAGEVSDVIHGFIDKCLVVDIDYSYIENQNQIEREVPKSKMLAIKVLSKIVYFFEYML